MTFITQEHLDFMEEAKKAFEAYQRYETYRNDSNTLIALRYGVDRDCIQIFKLGSEVAFFENIMSKAPELYVGDLHES
jgi:hypothetical protein